MSRIARSVSIAYDGLNRVCVNYTLEVASYIISVQLLIVLECVMCVVAYITEVLVKG